MPSVLGARWPVPRSFGAGHRFLQEFPVGDSQSDLYSYATHLDIKFPALSLVDVPSLVRACTDRWYNQTLCKVNDSVIRLGVMQGEYHWHKHDNDDEFFFVLEGHFLIDLEDRSIDLQPQEGYVVPRGVVHRTRAPDRAVILMVETASIIPTGDA
jgi:Cupin domain